MKKLIFFSTHSNYSLFLLLIANCYLLFATPTAHAALPSSESYKIQSYSFGAGGTASSSSTHYSLNGIAGEVEFGSPSSQSFGVGSGLTYLMKMSIPTITFSNPANNYERLKFVINTQNNPSDTIYAIAISTDDFFSNTSYIKSDNTIGTTLTSADYKTYTGWGGASGNYVTGLVQGTTYYIKVRARQGEYTESEWSPVASATTSNAQLTFSVDSANLNFSDLNPGNSYTDGSKTTVLTTSTNAYNGYVVNARESGPLTATGFGTIADYPDPNSAPTSWNGYGFGYTTNDTDLTNGATSDNRFAGATKYAGFTTSSPGDPVADHAGPVTTSIANENFTITYKVAVTNTQKAASYRTTVLYMVVPSY